MLVLSRKLGEKVVVDGNITVQVLETRGDRVRLGIEAPKHISVNRAEIQALKDTVPEDLIRQAREKAKAAK